MKKNIFKLKKYISIFLAFIIYFYISFSYALMPAPDIGINYETMKIDNPGVLGGSEIFKVSVFDINGDLVVSTSGTGSCIWNGRRINGEYVKPGLYILKVEISDAAGGYWKKLIRVLVKY